MKIVCPHCQATYQIKSGVIGDAGANVTCKKCAGRFRVEVEAVSLAPSSDDRRMVRADHLDRTDDAATPLVSGPGGKRRLGASADDNTGESKPSFFKAASQPGRRSLILGALLIFILGAVFSYGVMTIFSGKPGDQTAGVGIDQSVKQKRSPRAA